MKLVKSYIFWLVSVGYGFLVCAATDFRWPCCSTLKSVLRVLIIFKGLHDLLFGCHDKRPMLNNRFLINQFAVHIIYVIVSNDLYWLIDDRWRLNELTFNGCPAIRTKWTGLSVVLTSKCDSFSSWLRIKEWCASEAFPPKIALPDRTYTNAFHEWGIGYNFNTYTKYKQIDRENI